LRTLIVSGVLGVEMASKKKSPRKRIAGTGKTPYFTPLAQAVNVKAGGGGLFRSP
jgi:hypothetical protein